MFPGYNYNPPADNILLRQASQQKAAQDQQTAAMEYWKTPEVEGLFPNDYKDVVNRYNQVSKLAADYMRKGHNLMKPTTDDEIRLRTQLTDLQKQIEYDEQQYRMKKQLFDEGRKAGLSGKYNIDDYQTQEKAFLDSYMQLDPEKRLALGLPSLAVKQDPFDPAKTFNTVKTGYDQQVDTSLYDKGTIIGRETEKKYPEESRRSMALTWLGMPGGQEYFAQAYAGLDDARKKDIQKRAQEQGLSPLFQFVKDEVDAKVGLTQKEGTYSQKSAAWARLGMEKDSYEELSDMLIRQTAMLASGQGVNNEALPGGISGRGMFAGFKIGDDEIDEIRSINKGKDVEIILKKKVERGGIEREELVRDVIPSSRLWSEFIIPTIKSTFGSDSDLVLDAMSKRYKREYKGDLKDFDWRKVLGEPGAKPESKAEKESQKPSVNLNATQRKAGPSSKGTFQLNATQYRSN